ncbi:hypothetical protein U6A24_03625 [Aquimarina gracilis]|uniref:Uncharacterized protein n=1 Tax=Aquimarina gracilis TaxID=874422 RepID=A0ABU5ZR36_9FLAO|nr:hypothetical protein [Aquimarina gracilis]MEB3344534.1 hypothetical protein [Aquimarina gracilis]
MRTITLIFSLFLSIITIAKTDNPLTVEQEGLTIEVVNFEEGDKLKLFEVETGDHILSKSYARIDLSQLPVGSYLLENNQGKSVVIDRLEEELKIDGAIMVTNEDFVVADADKSSLGEVVNVNEEVAQLYANAHRNLLSIQREEDLITVLDFEEGDKIKLFEVVDTIHVLSKTTNVVDLSLLPAGQYLLENNKGYSVVIEKFENVEQEENSLATM